jgi:predicted AAA+ superfamily ATPase
MTLLPALGNYAAGARFWDREREVRAICSYLADGQSVLITGPRRVGKTSIVRRVLHEVSPTMRPLFLDVEQYGDPAEMFAALAAAASRDVGFLATGP